MSDPDGRSRHSEAASAFLILDPEERARREAENGLRQFDSVVGLVQRYLAERWRFAIPDLISENKKPYYGALEAADERWASQREIDLIQLEEALGNLLAEQLVSALEEASGRSII